MKDVLEFIKANWQLLVAALVFILSFILQLIKKKPISDILSWIYEASIDAVNYVEYKSGVVGSSNKKSIALQIVTKKLEDTFPNLNAVNYLKVISSVIEKILTTPKKGGNADGR